MPKKLTHNQVKLFIENEGWKLFSKEYKNNNIKLEMICDQGHEQLKTFNSFQKGYRCAICSGKKKYTHNQVKLFIENENWKLISKEYKGNHLKLEMICPECHKQEKTFNNFKTGERCAICSGKKKYTHNQVKLFIENENWKLISKEYKGNHLKLEMICPEDHKQMKSFSNFTSGFRCRECVIYRNEEECRDIIQDMLGLEFKKIRPKWLRGLELDGYNEQLNLAFEYNGEQHYNYNPHFHRKGVKQFIHQICRDKVKRKLCKKNDVDLIIIPYHVKNKYEFVLASVQMVL
jgi:hypothetical protein